MKIILLILEKIVKKVFSPHPLAGSSIPVSIFQPATLGTTASPFRTGSGTLSSSTRTLEGYFLQRSPFISSHSHSHSVLYSSIRNSDIGIGATVHMRSQIPMAFIQNLSMQKRKKEDMIEKKMVYKYCDVTFECNTNKFWRFFYKPSTLHYK